jgi:O-antigen/teichoic acid export membrane protein
VLISIPANRKLQLNIKSLFHRHQAIAIGSLASGLARVVFSVTMLITTGIATRIFTREEFGLWAIILSFIYLGFAFDFGYRSALTNRLAAMVADSSGNANNQQRDFFLSIFYLQIAIGLVGALLFLMFGSAIPWANLLKVNQPEIAGHINQLMILVFFVLFINVPLLAGSSAFIAFQEVHLNALLEAAQWIVLLFVFCFFALVERLSFYHVVYHYFVAYLLIWFIRTFLVFRRRGWCLAWAPLAVQVRNVKAISSVSMDFFLLNISALVVSTGGTFLAGLVGGLTNAGDFNLIQRLFGLLITMHMALMASFGPAFTQGASLGNWEGVRRKLHFCLYIIVPLLFIGIGGLILAIHPVILKLWTGFVLTDYTLAGLFALFAFLAGWGNTNSILLNSLGLVKSQAIWSFVVVPIFLFLTFYFGKTFGVEGVALAGVLCAAPGMIFFTYYARQAIERKRINV